MLKKLTVLSCTILALSSFSFHKIEEIYYDPFPLEKDAKVFYFSSWDKVNKTSDRAYVSFFLYDKHTYTQLHYGLFLDGKTRNGLSIKEDLALTNPDTLKFLKCDFEYDSNFWGKGNLDSSTYYKMKTNMLRYRKQPLVFNKDGSIRRENTELFEEQIKNLDNKNQYMNSNGLLQKCYLSYSNVLINNTEKGVTLSQKDKKNVDMTEALKSYFIQAPTQQDLVDSIAKSYKATAGIGNSEYELTYAFNLRNRKTLGKESYELLQRSTILALWFLIPQKTKYENGNIKKIESEMIGLARDDRDDTLYHWTTNLGQDLSILMNYSSK